MYKLNYYKNLSLNFTEFLTQSLAFFFIYKFAIFKIGLESFGLYVVILTYTSLIKLIDFGISYSALRYLSKKNVTKKEQENIIDTSFTFYFVYFLCVSIISYYFLSYLYKYIILDKEYFLTNNEYLELLKYSIFYVYLSILSGFFSNLIRGLHNYYLFSITKIIGLLIQTIFLIILIDQNKIAALFQVQIINHFFLNIVGVFIVFKLTNSFPKFFYNFSYKTFKKLYKYGIKFYFGNSLVYIFELSQKIFINHFGNFQLVGAYEVAYRLVTFLRQILALPIINYFPILNFEMNIIRKTRDNFFDNKIKNIFVKKISLFIFILFIIMAYPLSLIFFDEMNIFFISSIILLSIGNYINFLASPNYIEYLSRGLFSKIIISNSMAVVLFALFSIILGHLYSSYGIVISVSLSMFISSYYLIYTYER